MVAACPLLGPQLFVASDLILSKNSTGLRTSPLAGDGSGAARPVGEAVFVVVAGAACGPGITGHGAAGGFAGGVFVGVVGIRETHRGVGRDGDRSDEVVGSAVRAVGHEAVAVDTLGFTHTVVVGERRH